MPTNPLTSGHEAQLFLLVGYHGPAHEAIIRTDRSGRFGGEIMRWWMGVSLGVLLGITTGSYAEDRKCSPFDDDQWQGYRTWKPDRRRVLVLPDQFTIDKRGKCEVRCERHGREYKCKEYRC